MSSQNTIKLGYLHGGISGDQIVTSSRVSELDPPVMNIAELRMSITLNQLAQLIQKGNKLHEKKSLRFEVRLHPALSHRQSFGGSPTQTDTTSARRQSEHRTFRDILETSIPRRDCHSECINKSLAALRQIAEFYNGVLCPRRFRRGDKRGRLVPRWRKHVPCQLRAKYTNHHRYRN